MGALIVDDDAATMPPEIAAMAEKARPDCSRLVSSPVVAWWLHAAAKMIRLRAAHRPARLRHGQGTSGCR